MIYRNKLQMIYTPYGVIGTRECENFLNLLLKYGIITLKEVILWLKITC